MANPTKTDEPIYRFDDVVVDRENFRVQKGDQTRTLAPRAFDLLLYLIGHRGRVVEKQELFEQVWKEKFVTDNALTKAVKEIRRAIGDDADNPRYIETVPKRGYRFIAQERATPHLTVEPENADTQIENRQAVAFSPSIAGQETAPPAAKTALKNRAPWPTLAIGLVLLVVGALALWFVAGRNKTDETPTINRTSQITTWSGLEFYPSISPDGGMVAFSSDRSGSFEIYVKQLVAGAREVQITSDGGQNFEPAFSPDGSWLAYYSKMRGGIWVVPATGGKVKQLTEFGSRPAWSPDGSSIAFQSDPLNDLGVGVRNAMPPSTIWIVSSEGGEPRQLTQIGNPAGGHGAPSWSPDGKRILFDTGDLSYSSVWSLTSQGEDLKQISGKLRLASDAVYGADGKSIFLIADTDLSLQKIDLSETGEPIGEPVKIFDASGSRIRQLSIASKSNRIVYTALSTDSNIWATPIQPSTNAPGGDSIQLTQDANIRVLNPAFSLDGKKIAYQSLINAPASQIWTMDVDGKNQTQLTTGGGWSAWRFLDGNHIAFRANRDNSPALWSIAIDSGKEKRLVDLDEDVVIARISPDGKQIAFNSKRSGTINIWKIPIEGGEPAQLTFDKELIGFPAWSPDGRWIAFQMKRGEVTHAAIIPSGGGEITQLTFDKGQSWVYDWSPDGDKIVFAGQRNGVWNIYWVSRSTGQQKQLTSFTKLNSYVRYPAWSPLNDKVVYEYAETTGNIWMIELK